MAISKQVEEALLEVSGGLRNALARAARNERPVTINAISRLLNDVESLVSFDSLLDTIEKHEESNKS
tara:strand:+ start:267 stop:467 length:201 start_codon:yes stop_codon:yes gene_type:complete